MNEPLKKPLSLRRAKALETIALAVTVILLTSCTIREARLAQGVPLLGPITEALCVPGTAPAGEECP